MQISKAQIRSFLLFITNRLHLISNVYHLIPITSKSLPNLPKYISLAYGDLREYTNRTFGSTSVHNCSSNSVNFEIVPTNSKRTDRSSVLWAWEVICLQ